MDMYITLAVFVLLVVGFVMKRFSLGTVALFCVTLLYLTGVLTFEETYANFANKNVILVGSMFVLSAGLAKTPLVDKMNAFILKHAGGSPRRVLFFFFLAVIVLMQFLPPTATLTMLLPFALIMDKKGGLSRTKSLYGITTLTFMWQGVLPLSMGISLTAQLNGFMSIGGSDAVASLFERFIVGFFPAIVGMIFLLTIGYKMLPDKATNTLATDKYDDDLKEDVEGAAAQEVKTTKKDKITYVIFFAAMLLMFVVPTDKIEITVIPVVAALLMVAFGVLSKDEAILSLNMDILFMLAGIMGLSTALDKTGIAQMVADFMIKVLGSNPAPLLVIAIFYFIPCIVSQAFSNAGTMALLIPLSVSTAVQMGIDPVAVGMAVMFGANADALLPVGSPAMAISFGAGGYKFTDLLKPGVILMLLYGCATVLTIYLYYFVF